MKSVNAQDDFQWRAPQSTDSRGVCPGLNTLANQGYINRDGKNISFRSLSRALHEVYGITIFLSSLLAITAILKCGSIWTLSISLHDLALHSGLEHDASLIHRDAAPGAKYAPTDVDDTLFEQFFEGTTDPIEEITFVEARRRRERATGAKLGRIMTRAAWLECAVVFLVFGDEENRLSKAGLMEFFRYERLPNGWKIGNKTSGLRDSLKEANRLQSMSASLGASEA